MNIEIANRFVELRKKNGLSQEQLAEKIGVSRQAVSKWERSEASPDTDNLILLARLYNVSLDELLKTDDDIPQPDLENSETESADASGFDSENTYYSTETEDENINIGPDGIDINEKNDDGKVHIGPGGIHVEDAEDSVHIGLGGIHVKSRNGDEVHVGWDGIHVNEGCEGGNCVDVDQNGCVINGEKKDIGAEIKHGIKYVGPIIFAGIVSFICLGAFVENGWSWSWLVLFLIPVLISFVETIVKKDIKHLDTAICFGCIGTFLGLGITNYGIEGTKYLKIGWEWCWLVLLLIPILTSIIDAVRKRRLSHFCYPVLAALVFFYFGLFYEMWHPMWVVFLTIPVFYWIASLFKNRAN